MFRLLPQRVWKTIAAQNCVSNIGTQNRCIGRSEKRFSKAWYMSWGSVFRAIFQGERKGDLFFVFCGTSLIA